MENSGGCFLVNKIPLNKNTLINIDFNIVDQPILDRNVCHTIATINSISPNQSFHIIIQAEELFLS